MAITSGVDIGGTFTDFVWAEDGALRVLKLPTAPAQEEAFLTLFSGRNFAKPLSWASSMAERPLSPLIFF